jgi:hypothetical protein
MSDIGIGGRVSVGPIVGTPSWASRFFDALVSVGGVLVADPVNPRVAKPQRNTMSG